MCRLPLSVLRTMDCPTKRNFSGVKLQSLRCTGCGQVRFRKESFRSLELDVFSKRAWKQKMMPYGVFHVPLLDQNIITHIG
jgi:hypothetical protein